MVVVTFPYDKPTNTPGIKCIIEVKKIVNNESWSNYLSIKMNHK